MHCPHPLSQTLHTWKPKGQTILTIWMLVHSNLNTISHPPPTHWEEKSLNKPRSLFRPQEWVDSPPPHRGELLNIPRSSYKPREWVGRFLPTTISLNFHVLKKFWRHCDLKVQTHVNEERCRKNCRLTKTFTQDEYYITGSSCNYGNTPMAKH